MSRLPERVEIPIPGAPACDAKIFRPDGGGPWPAVLFYMDGMGLRPALDELAQRFAEAGYLVLQPNMYFRAGPQAPFDPATMLTPGQPERARLMGLITRQVMPHATSDLLPIADFLGAHPDAKDASIRVVGYCFGGRLALAAAGTLPDRVVAAASIHGSRLTTEETPSPTLLAPKMRAELYLAVAENDEWHTAETTAALEKAFGHLAHRIELYPGTAHGFAPRDTTRYDAASSERHVERVLALFSRHS